MTRGGPRLAALVASTKHIAPYQLGGGFLHSKRLQDARCVIGRWRRGERLLDDVERLIRLVDS